MLVHNTTYIGRIMRYIHIGTYNNTYIIDVLQRYLRLHGHLEQVGTHANSHPA